MAENLFTIRKSLEEICTVPDKIISVYSLEKHVWADSNSEAGRKARKPELQTIEEFQIDPALPHGHLAQHGRPLETRAKGQSRGPGVLDSGRVWVW